MVENLPKELSASISSVPIFRIHKWISKTEYCRNVFKLLLEFLFLRSFGFILMPRASSRSLSADISVKSDIKTGHGRMSKRMVRSADYAKQQSVVFFSPDNVLGKVSFKYLDINFRPDFFPHWFEKIGGLFKWGSEVEMEKKTWTALCRFSFQRLLASIHFPAIRQGLLGFLKICRSAFERPNVPTEGGRKFPPKPFSTSSIIFSVNGRSGLADFFSPGLRFSA